MQIEHTILYFSNILFLSKKIIFMIGQKGMTIDYCPFLLPSFFRREDKMGKNNESRGQKSCLSARSINIVLLALN